MPKKIYVNGSILIKTPYWRSKGGGLSIKPPEDSATIECNDYVEGHHCLTITENQAPSIFNAYYAKEHYTSLYISAGIFHNDFRDNYIEFKTHLSDTQELANIQAPNTHLQQIIYRHAFLSVIAALDTFVCDTILTKITQDKNSFITYVRTFMGKNSNSLYQRLQDMWNNNLVGSTEQKIINHVLRSTYCNFQYIRKIYQTLFNFTIPDNNYLKAAFTNRHLIAHKNRRQKDGSQLTIESGDISTLISEVNSFVLQLMGKITT